MTETATVTVDGAAHQGGRGTLSAGAWVEVYSNSAKAWCTGRVTSVNEAGDGVMVVFQLPGAAPDAYVEKRLPIGSDLLRTMTPAAAARTPAKRAIEWTPEEIRSYQKEFQRL